jgi:hypothetical protein
MDANEITCPKCGHLNNYISEGCVKCGIIFSKYFEMQDQQQEPSPAEATTDPGKENESPVVVSPQVWESVAPATAPADNKAQEVSEIWQPVLEVPAPTEVKPEETHPQPVSEISMDAIEMPIDALSEMPEDGLPIAPETAPTGKDEQALAKAVDETAGTESPADAAPVLNEVQTADQASVQETEALVTRETTNEPISLPAKSEATAQTADLAEPVEAVQPETEVKPKSESGETAPIKAVEPVKEAETAKNDVVSTPIKDENKVEGPEKEAQLEAEEEILLEEVAEPVKVEAKPEKTEDNAKVELLKKQKAALAKAEADKKKKKEQARAVALKKQKLAKLQALKKQKAAQAKAEALKKKKAELAKAVALKKQKAGVRAEALKQQKASQAAVENRSKLTQAAVKAPPAMRPTVMGKGLESNLKIMGLLKKYEGKTIGINYDNSAEIKEAELVEANNEFFSVAVKDKKLQYSYPLQTLLSLVEGEDGVEDEESESKAKFSAAIKVYPLLLF